MNTGHTIESLRAFEAKIQSAWECGELPSLIHLCGGNEQQLLEIFEQIQPEDWIFISHRGHYHCLLKGMSEEKLESFIRSDRSMFIFDKELRIYQSAILGGCVAIATGVAWAIKDAGGTEKVWCFQGDGATDNGHLYEAAMYATGHDLPVVFVIENNERQVDTSIDVRRGPRHRAFGMVSPKIREYFYQHSWPHAGSGSKHLIEFQRKTPLK